MAYGVYYRGGKRDAYKRVSEFYVPTRPVKFYATSDDGRKGAYRDLRCETIEQAQAVAAKYIARGFETKIKEVK